MIAIVEEPLRPNEYLYALDEQTNRLVLSDLVIESLNRYYFVCDGDFDQASAYFHRLLSSIERQTGFQATLLSAWTANEAGIDFSIRSKRIATEKVKQGWRVWQREKLAVATKIRDAYEDSSLNITDFFKQFEATILLFGELSSGDIFLEQPLQASVSMLAAWRRFSPSNEFLEWLARDKTSVMYVLKEESGQIGFVVVSPIRLRLE